MMKKVNLILLVTVLLGLFPSVKAQTSATDFKNKILSYLREEGYAPYIDESDESVTFKKEGTMYWITVEDESAPYYLCFYREVLKYDDSNDRAYLLEACNQVNRGLKCVKLLCNNKSVSFKISTYMSTISDFKALFNLYVKIFNSAHNNVKTSYSEYEEAGFAVAQIFVANTAKDGSIINGYDENIKAAESKFLKPRVVIYAKHPQTCTLYIKLITPDGLSRGESSPADYTNKTTLDLKPGYHSYDLNGWGSDYSGRWSKGEYTYEIWYKGNMQLSFSFTVS